MSAIKAGDLVMVVRPTPCCGNPVFMGHAFVVSAVLELTGRCGVCGYRATKLIAFDESRADSVTRYSAERLLKIDPPALSADARHLLELPA
jgi:hypothetical protein